MRLSLCTLLCALPVLGHAAGTPPPVKPAATPAAQKALREAPAKVAELIEEARRLEEEALRRGGEEESRAALLQQAISVLERALTLAPRHVEARVALGRALSSSELGEAALRRSVDELRRAQRDDTSAAYAGEAAQILGIVLSRLGQFQDAVNEYDRALLYLAGQPGSPQRLRSHKATILGNSAEALMAMGRLTAAIARYAQAEAIDQSDQSALHTLGLAVAYDRDGQLEKSRDALIRSLTTDPAMKMFNSDAVFFVPAGDRHYYVALSLEAFGDREAAIDAWQQFLRELPRSRYLSRARAHLDELKRTPGLSAQELSRAEIGYGPLLLPPSRQLTTKTQGKQRSEDDIERVALQHRIDLRQCYARVLRKAPQLRGELDVALVLDRSGSVALAESMRARFGDSGAAQLGEAQQELVRCAIDNIRRWRFAPSDIEHDEMALPIRFEARR